MGEGNDRPFRSHSGLPCRGASGLGHGRADRLGGSTPDTRAGRCCDDRACCVAVAARSAAEPGAQCRDAAVAVQAARTSPGQIATLILPANTAWEEASSFAVAAPPPALRRPSGEEVKAAANALRSRTMRNDWTKLARS